MKYILLVFVSTFFLSCFNEGNCLITATNGLHIQFKKKSNSATDTVKLTSYVISGVTFTFTTSPSPITEIVLPLNTNSDTTLIVFNKDKSSPDSILLGYVRQGKIISKECGAYTYFQNLNVLKTNLDSTQIKIFNRNLIRDPSISADKVSSYALNYQIYH